MEDPTVADAILDVSSIMPIPSYSEVNPAKAPDHCPYRICILDRGGDQFGS